MARTPQLLDRWGNPVRRQNLSTEVAAPTLGGIRSPISGYPGDGLNPIRLAHILRAADQGDPIEYLELAETIEERDPHYLGVLGTRKRSVSQIEVTVEAASDDPEDVEIADMVRDWLKRDELTDDLFHILDCIGKGYSFTEILWDASEGQWQPARLERRDPRHFRFARHDLATPMLIDHHGQEVPLEPFHFIYANIPAKSGLALRSGLARVASWGWMFKAFTQRDWAIFTQTYGQPLRVGKWHQGATEDDKNTLFRAVANIAGDCAAIIPDTMSLDFIESKNVGSSSDHYKARADWLDQQISKAVLGQTATTDAIAGGHAVGQEHRQVQEDIETADARALAGILNRDLIRPWVMLERGPRRKYPRIKIERPKVEDIAGMTSALGKLVPLGLKVQMSEVRDRLGFAEPDAGAEVLKAPDKAHAAGSEPPAVITSAPATRISPIKRFSDEFKRGPDLSRPMVALNAEEASQGLTAPLASESVLVEQLMTETASDVEGMLETIEAVIDAAGSLEEAREMLIAAYPQLITSGIGIKLAQGLILSHALGRAEVVDEDG
jgi:phage gp29-like protein